MSMIENIKDIPIFLTKLVVLKTNFSTKENVQYNVSFLPSVQDFDTGCIQISSSDGHPPIHVMLTNTWKPLSFIIV